MTLLEVSGRHGQMRRCTSTAPTTRRSTSSRGELSACIGDAVVRLGPGETGFRIELLGPPGALPSDL